MNSYEEKVKTAKWYLAMMEKFRMLMERLAVPNEVSSEVKNFVLEVAQSQYSSGNKQGIAWLLKKQAADKAMAGA